MAPAFFRPTYPLFERGPIGGKCSHSVKGASSPVKKKMKKNDGSLHVCHEVGKTQSMQVQTLSKNLGHLNKKAKLLPE